MMRILNPDTPMLSRAFRDAGYRTALLGKLHMRQAAKAGSPACDHRMLHKELMYEASGKVPLIVRLPGGQTCSVPAPVSLLGLVPTLLDLAGVDRKAMPVLHGTTLRPEHSKRVHAFRKALLDWMINTQNVPMPRGRKE